MRIFAFACNSTAGEKDVIPLQSNYLGTQYSIHDGFPFPQIIVTMQ
jgi:hypothetical protein